jgi:DNA-binding PadR family transcriptional regulator
MPPRPSSASALSPEYPLLGFLAQQPAHGYELHHRLVTDLGQIWHVSLSQAYNILNRLEAQGLITGTLQERNRLPSRRRFRLTAAGRRRFDSWLRAPTGGSVRAIRVEFITRLYFAQALERDVLSDLIETQTVVTRDALTHLQAIRSEVPPEHVFNRLGLELRIRQLASVLDWLAQCRAALGL